ncbi:hypothetical protein HPB49_026248 [Dermacentor silvarum]|nr:hypothetical protein HPB49_026248 [Dermacentor silvarum]
MLVIRIISLCPFFHIDSFLTFYHVFLQQASLWLSFYEIHNESINDLLLPSAERRAVPRLGEDRAKRTFVRGLVEVPVQSADEAHQLFAESKLNRSSSRSQCVFNMRLVHSVVDSRNWHVSTLMLCDLAGSEKPSKSGSDGAMASRKWPLQLLHVGAQALPRGPT